MADTDLAEWMIVHQDSTYRSDGPQTATRDGLSLYRAISRQMNRDPSKYSDTMNAVLDHFLRVWSDPNHGLHTEYSRLGMNFVAGDIDTFFGALSCPDVALSKWNSEAGPRRILLDFIANALNVKIAIWKLRDGPVESSDNVNRSSFEEKELYGDATFPIYHILATPSSRMSSAGTVFDTLLPDESGKALIHYMMKEKLENTRLDIKEMHWWWGDRPNARPITPDYDDYYEDDRPRIREGPPCIIPEFFNEYAERVSIPPSLPTNNLRSFSVFTVNIVDSQQIRPALTLLKEAMRRSPTQEIPGSLRQRDGSERPLRRYVGIDAEFLTREFPDGFDIKSVKGVEWEVRNGNHEPLCSILTIAVDRHVVFSFHVLHMLENPTATTVKDVSELFRRTIFNEEYLKIWFNFQADFEVLDATIAHMFQGTKRSRYRYQQWRDDYWVEPTFKFSSPFFNGQRPADVTFSTNMGPCQFHRAVANSRGRRCPCYVGNLDISAVLANIATQLGMSGLIEPRAWKENRYGYNYGHLLEGCFGGHRLFEILEYWKVAPDPSGRGGESARGRFYRSLIPGMELDERKMGYNIGDVVGNALIMRFLLTTDNRLHLALMLSRYATGVCNKPFPPMESEHLGSIGNYALIQDFPKIWQRRRVGEINYDGVSCDDSSTADASRPLINAFLKFPQPEVNGTYLTYVEHEERASTGTYAYEKSRRTQPVKDEEREFRNANEWYQDDTPEDPRERALEMARSDLFDPTKFFLPSGIFTIEPNFRYQAPQNRQTIIRAGTHHSDHLIHFIRSSRSARRGAPKGFMVSPGELDGLPLGLDRAPGDSLRKVKEIQRAFEYRANNNPAPSPPFVQQAERDAEQEVLAAGHQKPDPFTKLWLTVGKGRKGRSERKLLADTRDSIEEDWTYQMNRVETDINREKEKRERKDAEEGTAGRLDQTDIFDPEERNHRRTLERGPRYNSMVQYRRHNVMTRGSFAQELSSRAAMARQKSHQVYMERQSRQQNANGRKRLYKSEEGELDSDDDTDAKTLRTH